MPVSVCHHVSTTGVRPPPMCSRYHIQAWGLIGSPDRPQQPQRRQVVALGVLGAPLHVRADRGGRRVQDVDLVALDDVPPAILVGEVGRALVQDAGGPVGERAEHDVRVARHPPDVGRAPVHRSRASRRRCSGAWSRCRPGTRPSCARSLSAWPSCRWCTAGTAGPPSPSPRTGTTRDRRSASSTSSCHHTSRSASMVTSLSVRRTTTTRLTVGDLSTASSAFALSGTTAPRR